MLASLCLVCLENALVCNRRVDYSCGQASALGLLYLNTVTGMFWSRHFSSAVVAVMLKICDGFQNSLPMHIEWGATVLQYSSSYRIILIVFYWCKLRFDRLVSFLSGAHCIAIQ